MLDVTVKLCEQLMGNILDKNEKPKSLSTEQRNRIIKLTLPALSKNNILKSFYKYTIS